MTDEVQRQILNAFLVVMRPIARILMHFGFSFREFSEIAKTAFVDVATKDHGLRGRPTNISRVAVMTGLTRKEVRRIRDKIDRNETTVSVKSTPLGDIVHRWVSENDFLDGGGQPAILDFAGEGSTFSELVKRFGGDVPPGAMRTELKRVKAVEELDGGKLKLIRRSIVPADKHDWVTTCLVHGLYPLASNIHKNLTVNDPKDGWVQQNVYSQSIRNEDLTKLRRISSDRLREFSESMDDVFMGYEALGTSGDDAVAQSKVSDTTVLVGLYYFEENDPEIVKIW